MPDFLSTWELSQRSGESHTSIRVRNLQTSLPIGRDAWGRPGKMQPVLISSSVSLLYPFSSASSTDTVTPSTVHYGILSKAILGACQDFIQISPGSPQTPSHASKTLATLIAFIHLFLTHTDSQMLASRQDTLDWASKGRPVLDCDMMRKLDIEVLLPKASLLGTGVSLQGSFMYEPHHKGPCASSMSLKLRNLSVPTLVGVNANERLGKQIVVANVELDRYDSLEDCYNELEELVVKTMEESSFQTLETLATWIGERIIKYFLIPRFFLKAPTRNVSNERIRICLEKPTAVTFADAPAVEMLLDSDLVARKITSHLMREARPIRPPFPLQGRLDEWIIKNDPEKLTDEG